MKFISERNPEHHRQRRGRYWWWASWNRRPPQSAPICDGYQKRRWRRRFRQPGRSPLICRTRSAIPLQSEMKLDSIEFNRGQSKGFADESSSRIDIFEEDLKRDLWMGGGGGDSFRANANVEQVKKTTAGNANQMIGSETYSQRISYSPFNQTINRKRKLSNGVAVSPI